MTDPFQKSAIGLTESDFLQENDPFVLFSRWFAEASSAEPDNPNAMSLATVDDAGLPDVRIVLLKECNPRGFVFYTNYDSQKGCQLRSHPKAALVFYWKSLNRQIRARGLVEQTTANEADAYFATRPRGAQIGAWASQQSRTMAHGASLKERIAQMEALYTDSVPRPEHWGGFRLVPLTMEFWADRPFRLHDRLQFTRPEPGAEWVRAQLYP